MIRGRLQDCVSGVIILPQVRLADSAFERMKGLLGAKTIDWDEGLLIRPCNSVHSLFMRFTIDVIYLDKSGVIKKIVQHMKPWRFSFCFSSVSTLEMAAGKAASLNLKTGQKIQWLSD